MIIYLKHFYLSTTRSLGDLSYHFLLVLVSRILGYSIIFTPQVILRGRLLLNNSKSYHLIRNRTSPYISIRMFKKLYPTLNHIIKVIMVENDAAVGGFVKMLFQKFKLFLIQRVFEFEIKKQTSLPGYFFRV